MSGAQYGAHAGVPGGLRSARKSVDVLDQNLLPVVVILIILVVIAFVVVVLRRGRARVQRAGEESNVRRRERDEQQP